MSFSKSPCWELLYNKVIPNTSCPPTHLLGHGTISLCPQWANEVPIMGSRCPTREPCWAYIVPMLGRKWARFDLVDSNKSKSNVLIAQWFKLHLTDVTNGTMVSVSKEPRSNRHEESYASFCSGIEPRETNVMQDNHPLRGPSQLRL